MRNSVFVVLAAGLLSTPSVSFAAKEKMSPLQLQQMQSKEFEADKGIVFGSVMSVLQDSGYRISAADKDTGLITGIASTNTKITYNLFTGFGRGKKTPVVSAFIEDLGPTVTKVRLSFVMSKKSSSEYGVNEGDAPILDPSVYQDAFEKISQALFIRQSLKTSAPAPAAPQN